MTRNPQLAIEELEHWALRHTRSHRVARGTVNSSGVASLSADQKLERLRAGRRPAVLDLFAGCGGLSLGLLTAGHRLVGAVDEDQAAASVYAQNLPLSTGEDGFVVADLSTLGPQELFRRIGASPDGQTAVTH